MDISDRANLEFDLIKDAADALAEHELLKEIEAGDE
jgi:aminopeptidase-like protein